jgi:transcription initiation factor TFIID subunit 1
MEISGSRYNANQPFNSIKEELARLERNKERRHAREKAKAPRASAVETANAGSPSTPTQSIEKPTGTTRKCANCGQAGHIKTNKKYCPKYR